ncbi:MAG: FtsX-like permease family protein, partial [Cyclobacteriaceae bacterium]|nr:FtsX-like permease family protein [Cyclobacteriaceae bacterium]
IIGLLLACVNYVNLSTAQAGQRAKEVGIRKVMGVTPLRLRAQFLWESSIIVIISLLLSVFVAEVSIPFFNSIIGSSLEFSQNNMWTIALFLLLFLVVIVILAGIYPAFYLSRFNPSEVLKSRSSVSGSSNFLRKFLVVFQFMITISLISCILIINRQFDFIRKSGISDKSTSQVVISMNNQELYPYYDVIKDGFSAISGIEAIAGISNLPGSATSDMLLYAEGKTMEEAVFSLSIQAEGNYIDLMGYNIVSGRNFNSNWTVDRDAKRVIVNEKFVNDLGFTPEEAIGEKVYADFGERHLDFEIIGVIENFHQLSLHKEITGVVFSLTEGKTYRNILLNVKSDQYEDIMLQAKSVWEDKVEGHPFEPTLLDDLLMQQYKKDSDTFNLILFFSVLSVIISCLGLYAMSVFIAERKFKEIGVRKAMGASLGNIVALVSFGMTKLLIISFVLSVPIVYFAAQEWLKTFAYHIPIEYTVFIFSGIISLIIGWSTISYQTLKAAYTNPSEVLKDE